MIKKDKRQTIEYWSLPENLEILRGWRRSGSRIKDIANEIGITTVTLQKWRERNDDIKDILAKTEKEAVSNIVNALYKSAEGSFYDEVVREYTYENGQKKLVGEKTITRYVPPVPTSIIFYLSNRQPELWQRYNKEVKKGMEERGDVGIIEIAKVIEDDKEKETSDSKDDK